MAGQGDANQEERPPYASDETTPLLANGTIAPTTDPDIAEALRENDGTDDIDRPLPKFQIMLLCYTRMVEPIAFFGIFPFVNQMVQKNGSLPEEAVGFYSGLIESLFSLTQMVVMIFWGRVSDRVGRKPVLVFSLVGVTIMAAAFGLAQTVWQMILFRCLAGVFAGTVVTVRTMLTELSTPKTQAQAFSFYMFAGNLGILVGPLVGGVLADPAAQYGGVFKKYVFFERYPYALATFTLGLFGLTAALVAALFIKETRRSKTLADNKSANGKPKDEMLSMWQLVKSPGVATILYLYSHVMMMAFGFTAVAPVFLFTSVRRGGCALTPVQISIYLSVVGASQAIWTLFVFPPLHKRFGTGWILRACSIAYVFFYTCFPLGNLLLRHAEANHKQWEVTLFWVAGLTLLSVGSSVSLAFTAIQLALNDISPSPATLGTLNGLALSLSSGVRAFSPALFTTIFAIGVEKQILGGHLVWSVLLIMVGGMIILAWNLPSKAEGRPKKDSAYEEETSGDTNDGE